MNTNPTTELTEPDNPSAYALARHIADHSVSTIQAAFRYLNAPIAIELHDEPVPVSSPSAARADDRAGLRDRIADGQGEPAAPLAAGLPLVQGNCPACRSTSLFLGDGGYVTCSRIDCPAPDAATTMLERRAAVPSPGGVADETPAETAEAPYPPVTEWRTETQRRGDHWSPWCGARYELAEARADFAETVANDQGRHTWRLVRATTTYAIEAEHTPEQS